jgi:hypothetical protein
MTEIPKGLRTTYLINFIFALVFGLAGTFAAKLVGSIAGHAVRDADVNALLGVAALTLAIGSGFALRATRWEQISVLTLMQCYFCLAGGLGGLVAYFAPGLLGMDPLPPVQLLVAIILLALGLAFSYFYFMVKRARSPLSM